MALIKSRLFALVQILLSFNTYAAGQQLANYLGTGSNPRLHVELSANGPAWKTFNIDYQKTGTIPWIQDSTKNWSSWNVKDENQNYYGTFTLKSDGVTATWDSYTPAKDHGLEGIHFVYNVNDRIYELKADKITGGGGGADPAAGPFADAPLAAPAVYPGTNTKIELSVKGANIINNKGKLIVLKGIVRPSLEWNPQGQFLSEADIKKMRAWHANVIRLDLNQNYWFDSGPVTQKGSYKQILNAIVHYATQNNMAVIFDLHWTENGHQSSMANKKSLDFWKEVATDYKGFGTVIFELFNEPIGIEPSTWLKGNASYAGHQELYDAVRSTGAKNICIVNGLDWGYDLSFVNNNFRVIGDNIVYGSHPYNEKKNFEQNFKGVLGLYPLIFTEFGVNSDSYFPNGYQAVYQNILDFANRSNISYSAFAWWVDGDLGNQNRFPQVIKDWEGTPMNGGVLIHDDMKAHPGSEINLM